MKTIIYFYLMTIFIILAVVIITPFEAHLMDNDLLFQYILNFKEGILFIIGLWTGWFLK